jgi:hypothetical protein
LTFKANGSTEKTKTFDGSGAVTVDLVGTTDKITVTPDDTGKFTFNIGSNVITTSNTATSDKAGIVTANNTFSADKKDSEFATTDVATAKHVKDAYTKALEVAAADAADKVANALEEALGDSAGAFKYKGEVRDINKFNSLTDLKSGDVYIATGSFDVPSTKTVTDAIETTENGDMLIYNGTKWSVVQRNIDKAVTYASSLSDGNVILGSSTSSIKKLDNPTKEQVLRYVITDGKGSVKWGDDTPNRAVSIIKSDSSTDSVLSAASTNALVLKSGDDVYLTKDDSNNIVINSKQYDSDNNSIVYSQSGNIKTFKLPESFSKEISAGNEP